MQNQFLTMTLSNGMDFDSSAVSGVCGGRLSMVCTSCKIPVDSAMSEFQIPYPNMYSLYGVLYCTQSGLIKYSVLHYRYLEYKCTLYTQRSGILRQVIGICSKHTLQYSVVHLLVHLHVQYSEYRVQVQCTTCRVLPYRGGLSTKIKVQEHYSQNLVAPGPIFSRWQRP